MEPRKLTDLAVDRIQPPARPLQEDHWDALLPGFGLRVSHGGSKSWLVMVRILELGKWKQTRLTLGRYLPNGGGMSLAEARDKARAAQALAMAGKDPRTMRNEKRRELETASMHTFGVVRDRYIAFLHKRGKRSAGQIEKVLKAKRLTDLWETRPITEIPRREVIAFLKSIDGAGHPIAANRTLTYLRSAMNWAAKIDSAEYGYEFSVVPTDHVAAPAPENKRDRFLSDEEIKFAWQAFDAAGPFAPLFKVLLLTGQRLREVAEMKREELKLDSDLAQPVWVIPASRTKNKRSHVVPLSALAVSILRSIPNQGEFVFTTTGRSPVSGFSKAKNKVDAAIAKALEEKSVKGPFRCDWRIHDLRRTFATGAAELGASREVVERCLNHSSGLFSGVAGIYNRSEKLQERRAAHERWAEHVEALLSGKDAPQKVFSIAQA